VFTTRDDNFSLFGIDAGNFGLQAQIDAAFGVEIVGAAR
jgi:hypothetical protein